MFSNPRRSGGKRLIPRNSIASCWRISENLRYIRRQKLVRDICHGWRNGVVYRAVDKTLERVFAIRTIMFQLDDCLVKML